MFKKIFGRKPTSVDLNKEISKEKKRIAELSLDEALSEYNVALKDYASGINEKRKLDPEGYDENTSIATVRDEIHDLVLRFQQLNYKYDRNALESLDSRWKAWCLERIKVDLSERQRYSSGSLPKNEWWWWIDRLDELSEKDLSTL